MQSNWDLAVAETSSGNPYRDILTSDFKIRTFLESVDNEELIWHRDKKDRHVYVKESNGWQFQYDNELPFELKQGKTYFVEAMRYHRVIKGKGNLVIEIRED
jgi:hypothetical protein